MGFLFPKIKQILSVFFEYKVLLVLYEICEFKMRQQFSLEQKIKEGYVRNKELRMLSIVWIKALFCAWLKDRLYQEDYIILY